MKKIINFSYLSLLAATILSGPANALLYIWFEWGFCFRFSASYAVVVLTVFWIDVLVSWAYGMNLTKKNRTNGSN